MQGTGTSVRNLRISFLVLETLRPRSFMADWPVPGPVLGGMLRPISNPDANGIVARPGTKIGPEPKLASLFPVSTARNGTGLPALRIGSGSRDNSSCRAEATATQAEATVGRRRMTAGRCPSPSSSFSPVIHSLSPSSSSSPSSRFL
jgi:hypothetical protein